VIFYRGSKYAVLAKITGQFVMNDADEFITLVYQFAEWP